VQAAAPGFSLEYLGGWSNTGYLDLEVKRRSDLSDGNTESAGALAGISSTSQVANTPDPVLPDGATTEDSTLQGALALPQKPATGTPIPLDRSLTLSRSRDLKDFHLVVKAMNSQEHVKGLKKTRGGIGSLKYDTNQKTVDSFFKKRKLEPNPGNDSVA
jgi:hypothetical protein